MDEFVTPSRDADDPPAYRPPTVVRLGTLADLTRGKEVGAADGTVFQGIDLGS